MAFSTFVHINSMGDVAAVLFLPEILSQIG